VHLMKSGIISPNPLLFSSSAESLISLVCVTMVQIHLCFRCSWILAKGITDLGCQLPSFAPLYQFDD
jgi:hypothetical protein